MTRLNLKKKITAVLTAALLSSTIIMTGCGNANENQQADNQNQESVTSVSEEAIETDNVENAENNLVNEENISEDNEIAKEDNMENNTNFENNNETNSEAVDVKNKETAADSGNVVNTKSAVKSETATPFVNHGKLNVQGTKLVDKTGKPYQIQGVSTHGIAWFPEYVNRDAFKTMRDEWGINCVRLAMYSAENNGYCTGGNQAQLKSIVNNGVSYATELGLYVIIDWHVLGDRDPNVNKAQAIAFFDEMSKKYATYDNVIYEICNEPNSGTSWASIKSYANEVIPVIKANNKDAIIIVGTPTWSQDVDQAAADPITGYNNIMYTIHFYAETHRDDLRNKMKNALAKGLPIFCSEFGICDASGNGAINEAEANKWIADMQAAGVGYCIWNLSNKAESSSLINSGCNKTSGWTTADLSQEGKWYLGILGGKALGTTTSPASNDNQNNQNNNDQNNNQGNNSQTPAVKASSANTEVSLANTGNWNDGTNNFYQYTVTIKNNGSSPITDWKVTVDLGTNVKLDQSWSGVFSVNGSNIVISSCDYNKEIAAGNSCEIGFIAATPGTIGNVNVSVN